MDGLVKPKIRFKSKKDKNRKDKVKTIEPSLSSYIKDNSQLFVVMGVFGAIVIYLKTIMNSNNSPNFLLTNSSNITLILNNFNSTSIQNIVGSQQSQFFISILTLSTRSSLIIFLIIGYFIINETFKIYKSLPRKVSVNQVGFSLFLIFLFTLMISISIFVCYDVNYILIILSLFIILMSINYSDKMNKLQDSNKRAIKILSQCCDPLLLSIIIVDIILLFSNTISDLISVDNLNNVIISILLGLFWVFGFIVFSIFFIIIKDAIIKKFASSKPYLIEYKKDLYDLIIILITGTLSLAIFYYSYIKSFFGYVQVNYGIFVATLTVLFAISVVVIIFWLIWKYFKSHELDLSHIPQVLIL